MFHPNKNTLLQLYENDGTPRKLKTIREHVTNCPQCAAYLHRLQRIEGALNLIEDIEPLSDSFILIQNEIRYRDNLPVMAQKELRMWPLFQFMGVIGLILSLVFIIQRWFMPLSAWEWAQQCGFIARLGSYGTLLVLVFGVMSFIVLSLTPILILENNKLFFPIK
ncbi:hypothetical protein JW964_07510 [candidate division KSB1 bacterium]|nr:hypothetical protein [candidate division KSB1 bacterium]